jgi:alpha-galactosidase
MRNPVTTIIGAASTTFGPKVLRDIRNHPDIYGAEYRFVDINPERLDVYTKLARGMNKTLPTPAIIKADTERCNLLPGSDYVIVSVDTGHYSTWRNDFELPAALGSKQVIGELGGPGGMFHALRQIPLHLEIAKDIAELAPNATVFVLSNPLNRICLALHRYGNLKQIIGLCHGVEVGTHLYLNKILNIDGDELEPIAAGVNHFTWILELRRKSTGEDLYPLLKETLAKAPPDNQMMCRKIMDIYGYFLGVLDSHSGEYIPYAYDFDIPPMNFDVHLDNEHKRWEYLTDLANDRAEWDKFEAKYGSQEDIPEELRLDEIFSPRTWADTLIWPIINAVETNQRHWMPAVNMLNHGQIDNLPRDIFVETPAIVDSTGVQPVGVGALPKPLAAFNRRDIDQMELIVEAAVKGDRNLLLQAMYLDPVTISVRNTEKILDEMLKINAEYLPQFK